MIVPAPELRTDLSAEQFLDDLAGTAAVIAGSAPSVTPNGDIPLPNTMRCVMSDSGG